MESSIGNQQIAAMRAVESKFALYDRSHWGLIKITDRDCLRFLHNQSTNNFLSLQPGQGCDTIFVTPTGRTIDLVTAYVHDDAIIILVSPKRHKFLMEWLDKYIFFADKIQLNDITESNAIFNLIGPGSDELVTKLGAETLIGKPYGTHQVFSSQGLEDLCFCVGSGLAIPGYTMIFPVAHKNSMQEILLEYGAVKMSENTWSMLRILQGRPMPDQEITEEYNPLEVGLWNAISFNKGCYIGQETITRLNTYKGVKQKLWGIHLTAPTTPGSLITIGQEKVGKLTSYTTTVDGHFGLGYIRTKVGGANIKVEIGNVQGKTVKVPFISHDYPKI
ncbi:Folate-dependent protein for Fe/S cluster synthesis/repair in oxidative stress [Richelia intracellularis HH01]|uniref:Folate-dependent protein for Fe/S cluster synthesis/repair in oxidative stress n=1 Tax=Richelia intracellularis HH01 TaxID=1165094 RepID=M1X0J4_9NOST|nr:folate-binding protein YgfZ [Richelia intracellularis]CCH68317.1 Folate-dependent protein for Fe/S cluster synthesis/repair in oxidative stress [Richelia intracellularis HH01]